MRWDYEQTLGGRLDRRTFLRLAAYGGVGAVGLLTTSLGASRVFGASLDPSTLASMEFDVTYSTRIASLPGDAERVRVWMPLPPEAPDQTVTGLTITCPLPYQIKVERTYGNRLISVETQGEPQPFTLEARYHIVRRRSEAGPAALDDRAAQKYLRLTDRVRVTEAVEAFTEEVVGTEKSHYRIAQKACGGIIDLLTYDKKIPGCGTGDTGWIMRHKRGKCDDYHALYMAMLVSRGVPVRWEQGFPLPYPQADTATSGSLSGDCSGAHCWVSFHDPDAGWVPVDVSEADKQPAMREFFFGKLTPNRFKISEGRAVVLNPRQGHDPLSTFAYAYAEADGLPLIYAENYENTISFNITHWEAGE